MLYIGAMFAPKPALKRPAVLWLYIGGAFALAAISQVPSAVNTTFTWWGVIIALSLLAALSLGSSVARWLLATIGLFFGVGALTVQAEPLDVLPTALGVAGLLLTALLFTPAIRRYTRRPGHGAVSLRQHPQR
jgi:hypothetical protein